MRAVAGRGPGWTAAAVATVVLLAVAGMPRPVVAQDPPDTSEAGADTVQAEGTAAGGAGLSAAIAQSGEMPPTTGTVAVDGPFFGSLTVTPKAGVQANVRQNTFYGDMTVLQTMRAQSSLTTTLKWAQDEYRKQDKSVERRNATLAYGFGANLPLVVRLDSDWSWSRDQTTNTAGYSNLFAQDNRGVRLSASKTKYRRGDFVHNLKLAGSLDERMSENQGTANNSTDATLDGGLQTGWNVAPGVVLAGRIYATTASGQRTLGFKDSPASATGDSVGLGVYFDRGPSLGRVAVTRSNFERRFLDFNKNSNGLIDTVGVAEDLKVVNELETKDATTVEFENLLELGRLKFATAASRTTDDLDYAANGQGLKQRQLDTVRLASGLKVGVDSLAVAYDYGWKWDDQRIRGATSNRGRQYNKNRELELVWQRPFFQRTRFKLRAYQGLSQDIAQFGHNQNDKDRLQNDFSLELSRTWPMRFVANMVYSYRSAEDRSIRATRSSNNTIKDSYEIAPDYTWYVAPWLTWNQIYRVYIQYTDYVYSDLESVSRDDNYNKRGNLTTKVTLYPTSRLQLVLRHDFSKKFNATKTGEDAGGTVYYRRDLNQTISKLDLAMTFNVMTGVTLEAATYRTRDDRETFGRVTTGTTDYSGEMWVGTKINKTWRQTITLSAMVKKYNAFGPSVTESSSDYWEADVWLKWEF